MNKTAIKNFAIWARNKLIADITYKAGLLGIAEEEIKNPLPQSTKDVQFFDIGTKEPYSITGAEIVQRRKLAEAIQQKVKQSDYKTAYKSVIEEVAYTWFNRLIAVRFMEVNDYLPTRIRVLSSESGTKIEPDLVTSPFDADLDYTPYEKDRIMQLKNENLLDELFRMLFIKQCNALNAILPELFEKTNDYTELLMNVSFTDKDGVVYRLVNDIPEDDFNVAKEGQIEIIGWLYQYYNTEPKDETFALLKKNVKITKERIPAATQLFTPDWIVRYMVENSLGRLWIESELARHSERSEESIANEFGWKYYLEEAKQEPEVEAELAKIREEYKDIKPEDIKVIDPCMGSGHILVYAFDVLMQIYESCGYSQRDAAKSILENNLYGIDIDNRAYQLAYFSLLMKARQYNRRILNGEIKCNLYAIHESNEINREHLKYFGADMDEKERNIAKLQMQGLLNTFTDAKEVGSILNVQNYNWNLLNKFVENFNINGQMTLDVVGIDNTRSQLSLLLVVGSVMAQKFDVVVTNPPYMGSSGMGVKLSDYIKKNYPDSKSDLFACFIEKCMMMTLRNGFTSMVTMHSWMFLSSFEKLREYIVRNKRIMSILHLGMEAFDDIIGKVVSTVAFVLTPTGKTSYKNKAVRLVEFYDSRRYLKKTEFFNLNNRSISRQMNYTKIPGTPIAYWVNENVISAFEYGKPIEKFSKVIVKGIFTGDNERFLRLWHEINSTEISTKWRKYSKGGGYRKWFGNQEYVINWNNNGAELKEFQGSGLGASKYFGKNTFVWTKVSYKTSFRYNKCDIYFDDASPAIVFESQPDLFILGLINSKVVEFILNLLAPTLNFQIGDVKKIPIIYHSLSSEYISEIVNDNTLLSQSDWDSFETSWDFKRHPFLCGERTIAGAYTKWEHGASERFNTLKANEEELNRIFIDIYGLQDELTPEVEDKDVTVRRAELGREIRSLISYAVGCMFGRYSLDVDGLAYAGGEWDDSKYSTFIPDKDNVLPITDEEYFEDDVVGLFCAFLKKTFGEETLEENLDFIAKALGNKGNSSREIIRNYFLKDFFKDHCKIYQKRPIYWLFDSGKADGFKALIYMHRYNEDTIGNLRIDYLHRMQRVYESEIARMQETIENSTNGREVTAATKRKEKLIKQLKETKEYDEKIAHLALSRIAIDLDDGVKVNYEKVQTGTDGKKLEVLGKI